MQLLLGLPIIVLGCLSSALGFALMKRSGELEVGEPFFLQWRWLLGFTCLAFLQTTCDAVSLSLLPLAVVAPFAGLTIVFSLAIAASGVLSDEKEMLSRADLLGAAAVLIGVACVSLSSQSHSTGDATLEQARIALTAMPLFWLPAATALAAAASCLFVPRLGGGPPSPSLAACGAASCGALSQFSIKVITLSIRDACAAGACTRLAPLLLVGVGSLAFTAPAQLALLSTALAARATLVIPLYQAALVSLTTLSGGVAFREFEGMGPWSGLTYCAGFLIATAGLVALSRGDGDEGDDELAGAAEDEEAYIKAEDAEELAAGGYRRYSDAKAAISSPSPQLASPATPAAVTVDSPDADARSRVSSLFPQTPGGEGGGSDPGPGTRSRAPLLTPGSRSSEPPLRSSYSELFGGSTPSRFSRASRLPLAAPVGLGLGVAVLETQTLREAATSMFAAGRVRSVSDGRALSRQRRAARLSAVEPLRARGASCDAVGSSPSK